MWFLAVVTLGIILACTRLSHWVDMPSFTPQNGPPIKWKQKLPEAISSAPALGKNGFLYFTTRTGTVYALDHSGAVQWSYRPEYSPALSAMMLDKNGNVYFSSVAKIFSLTSDGRKRWESDCPGNVFRMVERAALGDGILYATCGENLSALNTANGQELWRVPIRNSDVNAVALKNDRVVALRGSMVSAFDSMGNAVWNFPPPDYVTPPPRKGLITDQQFFIYPAAVGKDETLYMGSGDSEFSAFSPDGTMKWTYDAGLPNPMDGVRFMGSPVIATDDTVIAVSNKAVAYAFTPDGALRWKTPLGDPIRNAFQPSPLVGKDGTIYAFADHVLTAITSDGKLTWKLQLSDDALVPPALAADGTLYVATDDGMLYAVKTSSKGLASSSWPKYQGDAANSGYF